MRDHRGAKDSTVDSVVKSKVAAVNDRCIGVVGGEGAFNVVINGGSDPCKSVNSPTPAIAISKP